MPDYSQIETSALLALAGLVLKRAKLDSIPVTTREQALRVIQGVRPAPPRRSKINVKPVYAFAKPFDLPVAYKPYLRTQRLKKVQVVRYNNYSTRK